MTDYPGQQYGGNPGNYQPRPNTGYQPMQPQQPQLFRSQQQTFNRPSPGYPQPSPLGQPTPPMGLYQQQQQQIGYQDSSMGYNQQVTNRHLMNQSIDSPHMAFMNQDSPSFYSQQTSNPYMLSQDSPTMNSQRFSSPQMGMPNMSQTAQFGSSYLSNQTPARSSFQNPYFIEQMSIPQIDTRQSSKNFPTTYVTIGPPKPEKPKNFVHPASLALSKLLSEDLFSQSTVDNRADQSRLFPCKKAVRFNALLKSRRQKIADAEATELDSDPAIETNGPTGPPMIRGRIKVEKHLALIKYPKPTKTEEKEKIIAETSATIEENLPVYGPPNPPIVQYTAKDNTDTTEDGGIESTMLEELTKEVPKNEVILEEVQPIIEQPEQEKRLKKDKRKRQQLVTRLAVISDEIFIQPELVEPDVTPTMDPNDCLIHCGNILPTGVDIDGTFSILKYPALQRSFQLRQIVDADDVRLKKPEEWYQSLEEIQLQCEEVKKSVEQSVPEITIAPIIEEQSEQIMDVDECLPQSEYTAAQEAEWEEVMRQEIQPPKNELTYGRDYLLVPQREEPDPGAVALTKTTTDKMKLEKIARIIELIPWRSLQPNIGEGKPVSSVLPWHPPMIVPEGRIIVNKVEKLLRKKSVWKPPIGWSKWHPPLAFDERLIVDTLESLIEVEENNEKQPQKKQFSDPQTLTEEEMNKMKHESLIKFSDPLVTLKVEIPVEKRQLKIQKKSKNNKSKKNKEVNGTKDFLPSPDKIPRQPKKPQPSRGQPMELGPNLPSTMINSDAHPNKSILKVKFAVPMVVDDKKTKKRPQKPSFMLYRNLNDVEPESGRKSPSLITIPYKKVPELQAPAVPKVFEVDEPEIEVDKTKNPLFADRNRRTKLNDEKSSWLLTEFRVALVRQNQPPNIWDSNNQKMIDLMKTKGASIDSSVREDAKKTLKFLEEKAADLIGKHATIRNKLLQFCLEFSLDFDDFTEEDNIFYMKLGDFIIQLELENWKIKDGWSFWNVAKPIRSPNLIALMNGERWEDSYKAISRMIDIIPSSLTNEDKDVVCQSLEVIERDLQRYHADVQWRSHIFALNDMMPRTDITPFAIILPRPPCEFQKDFTETLKIHDKFESCRDVAFFKVQIDAMNPHPFPLKSCLTPAPFLTWVNSEYHKLGARFMCKLNRSIPIRYGAFEQLKNIVDEVVAEKQYINAYHILLQLAFPHMNYRVSDMTDNFIMYFEEDIPEDPSSNDYLISGFYFNHPGQIVNTLYIIKKEVIMNRLCESTCEQDPHALPYKYANATFKHRINVRLGEMMDGKFRFYFKYNCFLVEVHLKITDYGDVELEHLKVAHNGDQLGLDYLTVTNYEDFIEKAFKKEPIFFRLYQFKKLNEIIENTWHIPKLIDGIIGFLRNKCRNKSRNKSHIFQPVLSTIPRTIRTKKLERDQRIQELKEKLKDLLDDQKKKRKGRRRKINDHGKKLKKNNGEDPTGGNGNGKGNSANDKIAKSSTKKKTEKSSAKTLGLKGSSSSSDFDATHIRKYKRKLVKFIRRNLDDILLGFKQSSLKNRKVDIKLVLKYLDEIAVNGEEFTPPKAKQIEDKGGGLTRQSFDSNEDDASLCEVDAIGHKEFLKSCLKYKKKKRWYNRWKLNKKNSKLSFKDMRELRRQETMNKSKYYLHNIIRDKILWKKQMQGIPRQHRRGRRFNWKKVNNINPRLGYSWKNFIRYFNSGRDQYIRQKQDSITWPLLKDQRVTVNFGKVSTDCDEDNIELEEMDEFFNLSDSEDRENICGSSTFAPKIVKPLKKKPLKRMPTVLGVIHRLLPGGKKYLIRKFKKLKKDKQHKNEKWAKLWEPSSFVKRFDKLVEEQPRKQVKKKAKYFDYDARPTAMRFFAMLTRIRKKKYGLFPNEAIRHAAIALKDGPFSHLKPLELDPIPPNNSRSTTPVKKENVEEENKENISRMPKLNSQKKIDKILASSTFVLKDSQKKEPEKEKSEKGDSKKKKVDKTKSKKEKKKSKLKKPKKKSKRKKLVIRNKPRIRVVTESMMVTHQKTVQSYFEPISQPSMTPMYIEQIRSKLLRIWHYFKPYYKTDAAFERMLEIYGPVAIYHQLEFYRRSMDLEKREEETKIRQQEDAIRQQEYLKKMQLTGQIPMQQHLPPQQQQQMPLQQQSWRFQNQLNPNFVHPNMNPNYPMNAQRMPQPHPINPLAAVSNLNMSIGSYDPQGHFTQTQDFFADSSSSSTVSTPTSGPVNSPFTPSRSRRGRGGKRANMGDRTPSMEVGFNSIPLAEMQKFAKRGRPRKSAPISASPMMPGGSFPSPSPLSRPTGMLAQSGPPTLQPYGPIPMNYPGNQPMVSSYTMQSPQQFNQPYAQQRLPYPQQPQQSQQMYSMQMQQQMNANFIAQGMQQPQNYSYSSYEPSSSDDEETDPPPPKTLLVAKSAEKNVPMPQEPPPVSQFESQPLPPPELSIIPKTQKVEPPIQLFEKPLPMVIEASIQKSETTAPIVEQKVKETPKPPSGKKQITETPPTRSEKSHDKNKGLKRSKEKSNRIIIDSDDSDKSPKPKKRKATVDESAKVVKESTHDKPESSSSKAKSSKPRTSISSERKKEKREKSEKDKERARELAQIEARKKKMERRAKLEQLEQQMQQKQAEKAGPTMTLTEEERLKKEKRERKEKRRLEREKLEKEEKERERLKKEKKLLKLKKEEASSKDKSSASALPSSSVSTTKEKDKEKEKIKKRRRIESDDEDYLPPEPTSNKTPTKGSKSISSEKRDYSSLKRHDSVKSSNESSRKKTATEIHRRFETLKIPIFDFSWPPGIKRAVYAEIIPEPRILVKIPIDCVLKLYEAQMLRFDPTCALPKKTIQKLKQQCIDSANVFHQGLDAILDDKKRLLTLLESAQAKHKKDIQNMEKLKLEHQKMKDEVAKKKEMSQKPKSKRIATTINPNTNRSSLDMAKKPRSKDSALRAAADAEIMAATIQKATGSTIGMEALKSFKIPKVQEPPPPPLPPPVEEKPKEPEPVVEQEKERDREAESKDVDRSKDDEPDREYGFVAIYDKDSPRERERDKRNDFYNRRYSSDYDRRYDNDRSYDRSDRNRNDRYDDYHRDDYVRQNYHYQDRRGSGNDNASGGYVRKHRSPRGDGYDRRQNPYPSFRGRGGGGNFRGGRGNSNSGYRDDRSRDWKHGSRNNHDNFYEQQHINREAGAGILEEYQSGDFQFNDQYQPRQNLPQDSSFPTPQRKVLLPNRVGGEPRVPFDAPHNRPGGWTGHSGYYHPPPPSGPPPPHKPPLLPTPMPSGSSDRRTSYESKNNPAPVRPRETHDSPPDAGGLQIDDKSD